MKHLLATTATMIALAAPAFAGEEENKAVAIRALTEMFDAQNVELIDELYAPGYIQHSPSIADGRDGVRAGVTWMKENGMVPQREIHRALAEDDLVAIQSTVAFGEDTAVVYDIFRFLGGQVIEHWDVTQTFVDADASANGNSMVDGGGDVDMEISDADLARNQQNAIDFVRIGFGGDAEFLDGLFGDEYIQHNPQVPNGKDVVLGFLENGGFEAIVYQAISDGDLTLLMVKYPNGANGMGTVDLFRHDENGKIVEHWDAGQPIPDASEFAHTNGFF